MKKQIQISLIILSGLILTLTFQNCGSGLEEASSNDLELLNSSEPPVGGENFPVVQGNEDVQSSALTDPEFRDPGIVTGAGNVGDDKLAVSFDKGLKKKVRQGLGSRTRYYYGKWNFFADGKYFATFTNTGECGDTKQSTCNITFIIANNPVLRSMRSQLRKISITTINDDGFQSPRTAGRFAFIAPAPVVVPDTPPANDDMNDDDDLANVDAALIAICNFETKRCEQGKIVVGGAGTIYLFDNGNNCRYDRAESANRIITSAQLERIREVTGGQETGVCD